MKSILISIKPEWVRKILNWEKTIEVRKTAPKCKLPIEVYIYCTKKGRIGETLIKHAFDGKYRVGNCVGSNENKPLNGKVVAKFTLREVTQYINGCNVSKDSGYMFGDAEREGVYEKACLTESDIDRYCPDETFYAWHIEGLEIFDEPKELDEFGLKKAPQAWFYLEEEE